MTLRNVSMRKLTSALMVGFVAGSFGLVGCSDQTGTTETTKVEGPGGTTTVEKSVEVDKSGENPPPVSTDTTKP
jgi:hypothetical protein